MSITVLTGDCLALMRGMPDGSVDAVVTDPPFSSGTRREGAKGVRKSMNRGTDDAAWFDSDSLTTSGFVYLMRECALEWRRLLKPGGHILCFIDWRMSSWLGDAIESADLRRTGILVWDKMHFGMGSCFRNQHEFIWHFTSGVGREPARRDMGNVLRHKPVRNGDHPTEKPVPLLIDLISVVTRPGEVVLDPFTGSGSTGAAAEALGRSFIGIERSPDYAEAARSRIGREPALFAWGEAG